MKWSLVSRSSEIFREYHLTEGNTVREIVQYDPAHHSARFNFKGWQRQFFMEAAGFWGDDIIFRNEYGLESGRISMQKKFGDGGSLTLEKNKFHFAIKEEALVTLALFKKGTAHPLITCNMERTADMVINTLTARTAIIHQLACLLLGLCWYLMMPAPPEPAIEVSKEPGTGIGVNGKETAVSQGL
jgi:hypothetical protein